MSIKKYSSGQWGDVQYRKFGTATDTITTLPTEIIGDGTNASAVIKGNLTQSGTPTPSAPIYPQECGDKTANLLSEKYENRSINSVGAFTIDSNFDLWIGEVGAGQIYTISNMNAVYGFFMAKPMPNTGVTYNGRREIDSSGTVVITVPSGCTWIAVRVLHNADNAMLNTGSTALPYEPWGIKIPILSANTTTPVYLGEVETTRQIKQLVLTGQENWGAPSGSLTHRFTLIIGESVITSEGLSSHYMFSYNSDNTYTHYYINSQGYLYIFDLDYTSVTDFKAYLAAQYAAGTPVTIWYVLATPTTGTVNEPLRKIGTYYDSVTGTGIPTTGTAEQFDVDTTLNPSEVSLTYHGWHEHQDTVFTTE